MTENEPAANPLAQPLAGPAPVMEVARDLVRRALLISPIAIGVGAAIWQTDGALSVAYGLAIVMVNFMLAALLLSWGGRISFAVMGAAAMFGFLMRLGLIFIAVLLVKDQPWMNLIALGLTLIISHLALLFWEMRYVSGTLAHPGLKPTTRLPIHTATNNEPQGAA